MQWKRISEAPTDFRKIIVCFKGQFSWVYYIACANGPNTYQPGYAKPDWYAEIQPPSEEISKEN